LSLSKYQKPSTERNQIMSKGFIYALSNPAFPELLKIGFSSKDPSDRAGKLYTTGVPTPYALAYYCFIDDAQTIERRIHAMISAYRHNNEREFFRIDLAALKKIIKSLHTPDFEFVGADLVGNTPKHEIIAISRHGNDLEIQEMQDFAERAKESGLDYFVQELFYDSNSCCCNFKLSGDFHVYDQISNELLSVAQETISQFEWFGSIQHGNFIRDTDDPSEL